MLATHDTIKAVVSRDFYRGDGWCLRCGFPYTVIQKSCGHHYVEYTNGSRMFPICNNCWLESTPLERFNLCKALIRSWMIGDMHYVFDTRLHMDRK